MSAPTPHHWAQAVSALMNGGVSMPTESMDRAVGAIAQKIADAVAADREQAHDEAEMRTATDWHAGYQAGRDSRWNGLFRRLRWLPEPAYYWLLDRLTSNNGWRPFDMRQRQL